MKNFWEQDYPAFDMFNRRWALVTAGTVEKFNGCTLSWGSLGNIWGADGKPMRVVTVYVHPARYTSEFLLKNPYFTISFFPESCRKALGYMGAHSGREGDKAAAAGLTPVPFEQGITYREAELTFLCKKLYQHQFAKEDLAPEVQAFYAASPKVYPDFNGGWQPHLVFMGQVISVQQKENA